MRILLAASACLFLASCASTSVEKLRIATPPSLTVPCAAPVRLPERALTGAEVEILWGRDRSALRACASKHAGLVAWLG